MLPLPLVSPSPYWPLHHNLSCRGLWTTPFMSVGAKLWTAWDGPAPITAAAAPLPPGATAYGGLTGLRLQGPVNGATVEGPSDVMACKAYLTVIDTVLLPFDPSSPGVAAAVAAADGGAVLAAALGAPPGQCALQASARFNGTVLQPGAGNRQHTGGRGPAGRWDRGMLCM